MKPLFELKLDLPAKGSRQSAQALYRELKAAIGDGRLRAAARLPATRDAAQVFGVSRNTAGEAYERLLSEGLVVTRRGSGTYIAAKTPNKSRTGRQRPRNDARLNPFWLRDDITRSLDFWREPPSIGAGTAHLDFRPALIDTRLFPLDIFRRVTVQQLRRLEKKPAGSKSPQGNQGHFPLRDAIARHIALTRAVVCSPDDTLVTAGAQQAFDLLARTLVTPQKTVVVIEDPGYPPMRVPFAAAGAKLVPVPVDGEGLRVDRLPAETRIICVCPSHQFPLGSSMSARRRRELVDFARKHGAVIIEDDYDGEFRYQGSPMEALHALAEDVVFYVGTFSKCMWPALRLGFIVAPSWSMRTLVTAKNALDWHCPTPVQMGVARFMSEGHLKRHVRKLREVYRQRRETLLEILGEQFPHWIEPIPSFYGLHVTALVHRPLNLERVTQQLLKSQVKMHSLARYYLSEPSLNGLIFGLGSVNERDIRLGLTALSRALPNT